MTEGEAPTPSGAPQEDRTNRLMVVLVGLLGIAAVALLVLLISLLWPKSGPTQQAAAGYPIIPDRSILGSNDPNGSLNSPLGVAFDPQGNVWVSDTGNGRVLVFNQDGGLLHNIGEDPTQPGNVAAPYGIAFDPDTNRAYVADFPQGLIKVFDTTSGAFITTWPNTKQDKAVFGKTTPFAPFDVEVVDGRIVATTPDGLWFFDQDGMVVGHWGSKFPAPNAGQYNYPNSVAVDQANGQIIVADTLNKRVVTLDSSGQVLWISGSPDSSGNTTGYWQLPRGVAVGPSCNIYVVDTFRPSGTGIGDGYFQVLTPDGKLVSGFGANGDAENQFNFPEHLDYYGPDDLWAVADRAHSRVLLFRLSPLPPPDQNTSELYPKSFISGPLPPVASPAGILPSPSGSPSACPGPSGPGNFPWWLLLVALVLLIVIWRAARRIRKDRLAARRVLGVAPGVAIPEGAPDLSAGFDPVPEEAAGEDAPTAEEPETGP